MFDTVGVKWQGINWGPECADWLREQYPTAQFSQAAYDKNLPWEGCAVQDEIFGTLRIRSNKLGNFLHAERSLPKFMYGENCRVLSSGEAAEGVAAWLSGIERLFGDWWEVPRPRATAKVARLDLCYQKQVPCAQEVFQGLYKGLNLRRATKHGWQLAAAQFHLTGLTLRQNKHELSRWYDKGWESGNESYSNVLRHEEQLRGGKAGYYLDISDDRPLLRVDEARVRMNERYKGWGGSVFGVDVRSMLREHGMKGAAALALVARPDWEPEFKAVLSNGTFYRLRNLSFDARRREFQIDLSLPEDAWSEPMVL